MESAVLLPFQRRGGRQIRLKRSKSVQSWGCYRFSVVPRTFRWTFIAVRYRCSFLSPLTERDGRYRFSVFRDLTSKPSTSWRQLSTVSACIGRGFKGWCGIGSCYRFSAFRKSATPPERPQAEHELGDTNAVHGSRRDDGIPLRALPFQRGYERTKALRASPCYRFGDAARYRCSVPVARNQASCRAHLLLPFQRQQQDARLTWRAVWRRRAPLPRAERSDRASAAPESPAERDEYGSRFPISRPSSADTPAGSCARWPSPSA